jgi:chemotaxis signal transduction protein
MPSAKQKANVETLRREFDASFAVASDREEIAVEDFLLLRVVEHRYAVRLREISGIAKSRSLTRVPSSTRELLGVAAVRGELFPVFALAGLLEHRESAGAPSWLLLSGKDEPLAFAFHALDSYRRMPRTALSVASEGSSMPTYAPEILSVDGGVWPVISISALVLGLGRERGRTRLREERRHHDAE